ncbi:MAG: sugar phosphate isomerase/epimerase [Desulfomonile tiedjei]|nr:sugar phosphate isomerase/epimerase [Desulfomonile tiedjei]
MRFSFSTNAFGRHSVFEAVERIAAVGYEGVELLADSPHLYAESVTLSDVDRLKEILRRTSLSVANVNANTAMGYYGRQFWEPLFEPSLANPDPAARRWRIDYTKKCIDLAHALAARCVSVTSGRPVPGCEPEQSMDFLRESVGEVLSYAKERSVRIGIEYEPGLLIERYEELATLLEAMDSPFLGANLDLGHSHVLGEDPATVIRGLSAKIFHLHIEDIRARKHYHLIPGAGDMDFIGLFQMLEERGYTGFATVELYTYPHRPEAAGAEALHYLRNLPLDE